MRVEDLDVYNKLFELADEVYNITMTFPKFEMYDLGSQMRRSSNSSPANLAEGFGNKHTNIYTESISRAQGELRETCHHLKVAARRKYISQEVCDALNARYIECSKMLYGLEQSLMRNHQK